MEENNVCGTKTVSNGKSPFKKVWGVVSTVIVAVFVILALLLGGVRLLGFTPYAVLSGSMTPKYKVGSLVYVEKVQPTSIKAGEVITFVSGPDKVVVTHRVIRVDKENNCFNTKGDANKDADASGVLYENVLGRVRFSVPYVGFVSMFLSTQSGKYTALAAFFMLCFLLLLPELIKAFGKK